MEKTRKTTKKKNWFLAFFDDKSKGDVKWWNRNYFYAGTILIVIINILIFAFVKKSPWDIVGYKINEGSWTSAFYFKPTLVLFLSSFFHSSWAHVLFNMVCFLVVGLYLERKFGTFGLLGFVLFSAYISALATGANDLSVYSVGYSGVNFFLYAIVVLDYVFSFQKHRRNKTNIILGSIVIFLVYFAMSINMDTGKMFAIENYNIGIAWYPYDLVHNMAHYTSFVAGAIVGLFVETLKFSTRHVALKQTKEKKETVSGIVLIETSKEKQNKEKPLKKDKKQKRKPKAEEVSPLFEEAKNEKAEEHKVEEKPVALTDLQSNSDVQEKKLSAIPEEMKTVPVKRSYKKKKKSTATTKPVLIIKPVVGKESKTTKKDDKK